jgi:methylaspartate ammonia-lyase
MKTRDALSIEGTEGFFTDDQAPLKKGGLKKWI